MRKYIKSMAFPLTAIAVLLVIYLILFGLNRATSGEYVRRNNRAPSERVYDYADVLSDSEERSLEELIAMREDQIGCDIVLVTLDEPLREFAEGYMGYGLSEDRYVQVYADAFFDEYAYGYNKPYGDCCVFVDNWNRSDSRYGYAYNWLLTSGRAEDEFSDSMLDRVIDDVNAKVNDNPYEAYKTYVNNIYRYMSGHGLAAEKISFSMIVVIALVISVIYLLVHLSMNKGRRTTLSNTYVNGGNPKINQMQDLFLTRNVTTRKIQTSSGKSGGGGGHHTTRGGHSVGGRGGHH